MNDDRFHHKGFQFRGIMSLSSVLLRMRIPPDEWETNLNTSSLSCSIDSSFKSFFKVVFRFLLLTFHLGQKEFSLWSFFIRSPFWFRIFTFHGHYIHGHRNFWKNSRKKFRHWIRSLLTIIHLHGENREKKANFWRCLGIFRSYLTS